MTGVSVYSAKNGLPCSRASSTLLPTPRSPRITTFTGETTVLTSGPTRIQQSATTQQTHVVNGAQSTGAVDGRSRRTQSTDAVDGRSAQRASQARALPFPSPRSARHLRAPSPDRPIRSRVQLLHRASIRRLRFPALPRARCRSPSRCEGRARKGGRGEPVRTVVADAALEPRLQPRRDLRDAAAMSLQPRPPPAPAPRPRA